MPKPRVRVYLACSLDGFIAGPDHELDWLHAPYPADERLRPDPRALRFDTFLAQIGSMLMGRATYDVVAGLGVEWPYGEIPVHVATRRPLDPLTPTVRAVKGDIVDLIADARAAAGERDVYLDGGDLVRQGLAAGLVDEMTLTLVPVLLGDGVRLFDGVDRTTVQFTDHRTYDGGLVQLTARVLPRA